MKYLMRLVLFVPNMIVLGSAVALRVGFNYELARLPAFDSYCRFMDNKCELYGDTLEL